ncbi:LysR family transcriptional regulator [Salinibius halmophilus]|uniref:LysR family transcriptional regulator n=1 Tax=Salinibius halmophilus TaxID=1853216 RepID=UPI000E674259|nr:LysR family transcriptional regulator [Salinibius halmophilus]
MDHLESINAFCKVVETGGFSSAANKLDTSVARVSKLVTELESRLGARLLHRTTRSVSTTEIGEHYYHSIQPVVREIADVESNLSHLTEQVSGKLKVALPLDYGRIVVAPLMAEFCKLYPHIKLELAFNDAHTDLVNGGFDLAIRISKLKDSSLIARPISQMKLIAAASPSYLAQRGAIEHPEALRQHDCICYTVPTTVNNWHFYLGKQEFDVTVQAKIGVNNGDAAAQLATKSCGVILQPDFIVQPYLDSGELVPVLSNYSSRSFDVYAAYPARQFVPFKVQKLIEFLRAGLRRDY